MMREAAREEAFRDEMNLPGMPRRLIRRDDIQERLTFVYRDDIARAREHRANAMTSSDSSILVRDDLRSLSITAGMRSQRLSPKLGPISILNGEF